MNSNEEMVPWKFLHGDEVNELSDFPEGTIGFIYRIKLSDGSSYVGKKNLYSTRKKNFTNKELDEVLDKRKKTYKMVTKESDWKKYNGSNKQLLLDVKGGRKSIVKRKIITTATNAKELTYLELKWMILMDVLGDDQSYNDNILGKFFRKDLNIL